MIHHTRRYTYLPDTDSALARFVRATVAVQGFIFTMEHIPSRKLYYMSAIIPEIGVAEWLKLQEPVRRPKTDQPKTRRMPPAGCPLGDDKQLLSPDQ